jgi:hypothetical protein
VPGTGSEMPPASSTPPPHSVKPPTIDCPAGRSVADVLLVSSKSSEAAGLAENFATMLPSLSDTVIVGEPSPSVLAESEGEQGPYVPTGKLATVDASSGALESAGVLVASWFVTVPPHETRVKTARIERGRLIACFKVRVRLGQDRDASREGMCTRVLRGCTRSTLRLWKAPKSYSEYALSMERVTATLDDQTLAKVRRVAGPRGVSSFLNGAARECLARFELRGLLDELDAKHGAAPAAVRTEVARDARRIFRAR